MTTGLSDLCPQGSGTVPIWEVREAYAKLEALMACVVEGGVSGSYSPKIVPVDTVVGPLCKLHGSL